MRLKTHDIPKFSHYPMDPLKPMMETLTLELYDGEKVVGINDEEQLLVLSNFANSSYDTPREVLCHFITLDFDFDPTHMEHKGCVRGRALYVEEPHS